VTHGLTECEAIVNVCAAGMIEGDRLFSVMSNFVM